MVCQLLSLLLSVHIWKRQVERTTFLVDIFISPGFPVDETLNSFAVRAIGAFTSIPALRIIASAFNGLTFAIPSTYAASDFRDRSRVNSLACMSAVSSTPPPSDAIEDDSNAST